MDKIKVKMTRIKLKLQYNKYDRNEWNRIKWKGIEYIFKLKQK